MTEGKQLKCQKCGKPIGFITVTAKSPLEARPNLDNIRIGGTCMECLGYRTGFYSQKGLTQL